MTTVGNYGATMKPEPSRATQGISFELPLLKAAKEQAASRRMSLSAYVNQLIFDDLNSQPESVNPSSQGSDETEARAAGGKEHPQP